MDKHTELGGRNSGVARIHYLLMILKNVYLFHFVWSSLETSGFKLSMLLLCFNVITVRNSAFEFNNGKEWANIHRSGYIKPVKFLIWLCLCGGKKLFQSIQLSKQAMYLFCKLHEHGWLKNLSPVCLCLKKANCWCSHQLQLICSHSL